MKPPHGSYPLNASSISLVMTMINVSRHCQMSPGAGVGKNPLAGLEEETVFTRIIRYVVSSAQQLPLAVISVPLSTSPDMLLMASIIDTKCPMAGHLGCVPDSVSKSDPRTRRAPLLNSGLALPGLTTSTAPDFWRKGSRALCLSPWAPHPRTSSEVPLLSD